MKDIKDIIRLTKTANGAVAQRWNGHTFVSNNGAKGMICGYRGSADYWVYWYELRLLGHYATTVSRAHKDLKGGKKGDINYTDIPDELHEQLMALAPVAQVEEYTPDYSALDVKQLPGFIHCMEVDIDDNMPVREHYISLASILALHPHPDKVEHIYNIQTQDGHMWAYIPDHQFM